VPLNHFYGSRRAVTRQNISLAQRELRSRSLKRRDIESPFETPDRAQSAHQPSRIGLVYEKLIKPTVKRKHFVSDTARLNYPLMREMLASIRQHARDSRLSQLPIVLTNHPKDIRDWSAIERFVGEVPEAEDIEFITLSEVATKLQSEEFQIRTAG